MEMTSTLDIYRSANILVQQHGAVVMVLSAAVVAPFAALALFLK